MTGDDPAAAHRATEAVSSIPRDENGPVFREPWEAQAFAIAVALHERGVFTWTEWAAVLGEEIKRAQAVGDPDTGETYYRHWLAALERIVGQERIADAATLERYRDAWGRAAHRTAHGTPIELRSDDFKNRSAEGHAFGEQIAGEQQDAECQHQRGCRNFNPAHKQRPL